MKNRNVILMCAAIGSLALAGTAQAAGKIYVGGELGLLNVDTPSIDNAVNVGVYGGYNMLGKDSQFAADLRGGTLAIEGEVTTTVKKGDAGVLGDGEMNSVGAYAAYRHPITEYFYVKGRLGVVRYDIKTTAYSSDSGTSTSLAGGIGAGWKVGPGSVEVNLTTYESDALFLTGGFHMTF